MRVSESTQSQIEHGKKRWTWKFSMTHFEKSADEAKKSRPKDFKHSGYGYVKWRGREKKGTYRPWKCHVIYNWCTDYYFEPEFQPSLKNELKFQKSFIEFEMLRNVIKALLTIFCHSFSTFSCETFENRPKRRT